MGRRPARKMDGPPSTWEGERPPFDPEVEVWTYTSELLFVRIHDRVVVAEQSFDTPEIVQLQKEFKTGEPLAEDDVKRSIAAIRWLLNDPTIVVRLR